MKVLIATASHGVEHGRNLLLGEAGLGRVRVGSARRRGRGASRKGGGRSRRKVRRRSRLLILRLQLLQLLLRLLVLLLLHLWLLVWIELRLHLHLHLHRHLRLHLHYELRLLHLLPVHERQCGRMRFWVRWVASICCCCVSVVRSERGRGGPQGESQARRWQANEVRGEAGGQKRQICSVCESSNSTHTEHIRINLRARRWMLVAANSDQRATRAGTLHCRRPRPLRWRWRCARSPRLAPRLFLLPFSLAPPCTRSLTDRDCNFTQSRGEVVRQPKDDCFLSAAFSSSDSHAVLPTGTNSKPAAQRHTRATPQQLLLGGSSPAAGPAPAPDESAPARSVLGSTSILRAPR